MSEDADKLCLRGFVRVALVDRETGKIKGDTGFVPNKIMARGFQNMICNPLLGKTTDAGSTTVFATDKWAKIDYMGLGNWTGAAFNSTNFTHYSASYAGTNATLGGKVALTAASCTRDFVATSDGGTIRATGLWAGTTHLATDVTINSVAFFNTNGTDSPAMSAVTFSASTWSTDQDVKATYELRFSQT